MKVVLVLAVCACVALAQSNYCPPAYPIRNFKYGNFEGRWYEIGHYRNEGPRTWSDECFCSTSTVARDPFGFNEADSIYSYVCNLEEQEGDLQVFNTLLVEMRPPGKWYQEVINGFGWHDFTVVDLTDDYALVFRCGYYDDEVSYTTQILSRKPTLASSIIESLKQKVVANNLNAQNASYVEVVHGNCTYQDH